MLTEAAAIDTGALELLDLGWQTVDWVLLAMLPLLLLSSGIFSGSETALFGMSESDRLHLRRRGTIAARSVDALLADQRMLLITLMLGNMTINALYFVISSVLMTRSDTNVAGEAVMALFFLLTIVLLGEVLPKMVATARPVSLALVTGPLLRVLHGVILPLRVVVERAIVSPLARLTAPAEAPPQLDSGELQALLDVSGHQGVIDDEEQRILNEVFAFSRQRVRDVMTPRVEMHAVTLDDRREDVADLTRQTRHRRLPIYDGDLDTIVGVLRVRPFLLGGYERVRDAAPAIFTPCFVPQVATIDQLLALFRARHLQSAIVVDEFGGTAGIVAIRDVVEELVGDIVGADEREIESPRAIAPDRWRVSGDLDVHDWAEFFGQRLVSPRVSTLGGLIMQRLGRVPSVGDVVELGNLRLEVERTDRSRVVSAIVALTGEPEADE